VPAKNSVKQYTANSFYHVYNRGVEKRTIYQDEQDFSVFLSYIKTYLIPKDVDGLREIIASKETGYKEKDKALQLLELNNFSGEIELHAYSLIPNHFHFLIKQTSPKSMDSFLNSLGTRYTMYFNQKYRRVGKLYQGVYKAVSVENDEQLLHLSRYIHLNPINYLRTPVLGWRDIPLPNSLPEYLGARKTSWIKTEQILSYFKKSDPSSDYLSFLKNYHDTELIKNLIIDQDD